MCRVKDKVRRLARHHKVFLSDVTKLNDNLERAKSEARHALEAKKRMLQQALDRRFEEAMEAVDDEIQGKKLPLEQAVQDMKRSSAVLEAALETLEDKLKEPQHDFIQRFVPMIEVNSCIFWPAAQQHLCSIRRFLLRHDPCKKNADLDHLLGTWNGM
jgi:hypothetical protein